MWDLGSGQPENEQAASVKKEKQMIFFLNLSPKCTGEHSCGVCYNVDSVCFIKHEEPTSSVCSHV